MSIRYWAGFLTILVAIVFIVLAIRSIQRNTPVISTADPIIAPPTSPTTLVSAKAGDTSKTSDPAKFIGAIGLIEPSTELIAIGTNVPGIVSRVLVRPNDSVRAGQILLVIDDRAANARLQSARAGLAVAKSRLEEINAGVPVATAQVASSQSQIDQFVSQLSLRKDVLKRREQLVREKAISEEELISARSDVQVAESQLESSRAKWSEAKANLAQLEGSDLGGVKQLVQRSLIEEADASVRQRETDLSLQSVAAPCDGTILQVKIRPGEFASAVALSEPLITMGNIETLHVRAQIDEEEVPRFHPSSKAWASARGRPDIRYSLSIVRTEPLLIPKRSINGNVNERIDTRILQILYRVDANGSNPLFAGQQVDVYIED